MPLKAEATPALAMVLPLSVPALIVFNPLYELVPLSVIVPEPVFVQTACTAHGAGVRRRSVIAAGDEAAVIDADAAGAGAGSRWFRWR